MITGHDSLGMLDAMYFPFPGSAMRSCLLSLGVAAVLLAEAALARQPDAWQALAQGGYVVLLRHGAADAVSRSTSPDADFEGCEGQYNLTEEGRAQARLIGQAFKRHRVPLAEVLASPLCHTQDTARIAFGTFRSTPLLEPLAEDAAAAGAARTEAVSRRIAAHAGRRNLVLVIHQPNIDALTLEVVEPATMLVLKPDGKGGFAQVYRIRAEDLRRR